MVGLSPVFTGAENGAYALGSPSGCQIFPVFYVPGLEPIVMGTIDTITYSSHRDKKQVRPLGYTRPRGIARGPRTVAGTMIFKIFGGLEIRNILGYLHNKYKHLLPDELPKFSVIIIIPPTSPSGEFHEHPATIADAGMNIISLVDCEIVDSAFSLSIDDQVVEQQISYLARDIIDLSHITELMSVMPEIEDGEEEVDIDAGVFRNPKDVIPTSGQEQLDIARDTAREVGKIAQGTMDSIINSLSIDE